MKNKNIICIAAIILSFGIISCTDNSDRNKIKIAEEGLPVFATLDTRAIPDDLECELYVFWKSASDNNYTFKEELDLSGELPIQVQFEENEITNKEYRFLFVAHPATGSQIGVTNSSGVALQAGNSWIDVEISTGTNQVLGLDYYYDVVDKTGQDIVDQGTIQGTLTRMVGQMVLEVYRVNGTDIDSPADISVDTIASVLDRVYLIDVEYRNLTKSVSFNSAGELQVKETFDTPYSYTIQPALDDEYQLVLADQDEETGLFESTTGAKGGARIKSICGLTSSYGVRVKYEFKYYDTTPNCGNTDDGNHTETCYNKKSIVLNLPKLSDTQLLSIIPDTYTVNKAGIRFDRIIDLGVYNSYELDTAWLNETSNE